MLWGYTLTLPYIRSHYCLTRPAHIWPRGNTINTGALWLVRTPFCFNPNTRLAKQIEIAVAKYLRHWRLKNKIKYRRISINHLIYIHIHKYNCLLVFELSLLYRSSNIYLYPLDHFLLWMYRSNIFHTCIWLKNSIHSHRQNPGAQTTCKWETNKKWGSFVPGYFLRPG